MDAYALMAELGHEQLVISQDPSCGYLGIIAIHDTTLGPALGGTRFWQYDSTEAALVDALRLARGMTYKSAVAGLSLGGGKAVIVGDNRRRDREALFRAHGRFVDTLGGRYITAEDVGTSTDDMEFVRQETRHVGGLVGRSGDPSPVTAWGVFHGMRAAARTRFGTDDLAGRRVLVQGAGNVAYHLCRLLHEAGAELVVTDIRPERVQRIVQEFGARGVAPDALVAEKGDIYSPNALGATLNDDTIPRLQVGLVCGGANNQLAEPRHGDALQARGILYAPDYVVNGGGVINIYGELHGWDRARSESKAAQIYDTTLQVFAIAGRDRVAPHLAADRLAEERIAAVKRLDRPWTAASALSAAAH